MSSGVTKIVNTNIQMVDLKSQYSNIKEEIDSEIQEVLNSAWYIGGAKVESFRNAMSAYLDVKHTIPCANGTDALQIALMALNLKPGDEVIVPSFTYVATAEVIGLLGLKPKMIDVDYNSFNINLELVKQAVTEKTKVIIAVHLFGQSTDMEPIMEFAKSNNIYVIEDNAQAIGSTYTFSNGKTAKTGTIGDIGTTSFFPSKNLGCYGDGGAIFTNNDELASSLKMIANHGQEKKYHHAVIGCNSRLDAIQAAVLKVKLQYLDRYCKARNKVASKYDTALGKIAELDLPFRIKNSTHVFHQYTLKVKNGTRNELQKYLKDKGIPSMIYYPIPLYKQKAFNHLTSINHLETTERLCDEVISLPIHTEMKSETQDYIITSINEFFN